MEGLVKIMQIFALKISRWFRRLFLFVVDGEISFLQGMASLT
jgi:hypothetical protein